MQSKVVKLLALVLLLCGTGIGLAQQQAKKVRVEEEEEKAVPRAKQKSPPEKSKLEEMLAEALKNSPDIRVAVAKLAMAEAELNQARLQVMQKVFALHAALESQKAEVELRRKQYERFKDLAAQGLSDSTLVDEALTNLTAAKSKLAELEAQMSGLLGKSPQGEYSLTIQEAKLVRQENTLSSIKMRRPLIEEAELKMADKVAGPMAEKLRKALQTPVKVNYKDMTFDEILDDLAKKSPGLSIRKANMAPNYKISLPFAESLPISAILQALGDEFGCSFYVREYGIVAAMPNHLPPGAPKVEEFLRQKPAQSEKPPEAKPQGAKPDNRVQGQVAKVDASGQVEVSIGVKDGMQVGDILEVFRLKSKREFLGTIRIEGGLGARSAICRPQGSLAAPIQPGDQVISSRTRPFLQF